MTDLSFEVAGRRLAATLILPVQASDSPETSKLIPGVVFVHGLGADRQGYIKRAKVLADKVGVASMAVDLSGHGNSEGDLRFLTLRDHLRDLSMANDVLAAVDRTDPDRIGICAASYGAYLAVLLTSIRPIASLLLRAPALYGDESMNKPLDNLVTTATAGAGDFLAVLSSYTGRVMIVESDKDQVVTRDIVDNYLRRIQRGRLKTIVGAGHVLNSPEQHALFMSYIVSWAREL